MKNFYIPHYEQVTATSPQRINGRWRTNWYKKFGFEVNFSSLDFTRASKFIEKGFAPAIPLKHGIESGDNIGWKTNNYLYPVSFGDISDIPF
jgi:hypothetical protein